MRNFDKGSSFFLFLQKDAYFDHLNNSVRQMFPKVFKNGSNFASAKDNVFQNDNLTE